MYVYYHKSKKSILPEKKKINQSNKKNALVLPYVCG